MYFGSPGQTKINLRHYAQKATENNILVRNNYIELKLRFDNNFENFLFQ